MNTFKRGTNNSQFLDYICYIFSWKVAYFASTWKYVEFHIFMVFPKGLSICRQLKIILISWKCKCSLLCISTCKCMLAHAFAWSKTIKNALKLSPSYISLTWASHMHDEKSMFLIILERFLLVSTMQMHAQACILRSKCTTGTC